MGHNGWKKTADKNGVKNLLNVKPYIEINEIFEDMTS
jgi:hypothetical protein